MGRCWLFTCCLPAPNSPPFYTLPCYAGTGTLEAIIPRLLCWLPFCWACQLAAAEGMEGRRKGEVAFLLFVASPVGVAQGCRFVLQQQVPGTSPPPPTLQRPESATWVPHFGACLCCLSSLAPGEPTSKIKIPVRFRISSQDPNWCLGEGFFLLNVFSSEEIPLSDVCIPGIWQRSSLKGSSDRKHKS